MPVISSKFRRDHTEVKTKCFLAAAGIVILLLCLSCGSDRLDYGVINTDLAIHDAFIKKLDELNIPYQRDGKNGVLTRKADKELIDKLLGETLAQNYQRKKPSIKDAPIDLLEFVKQAFPKAIIPFEIIEVCCPKRYNIKWPSQYDNDAWTLIQNFYKKQGMID